MPQKSNIIPLRFNLPGIKKLLLPGSADTDLLDTSAAPARALFGPPTETAVAEKRSSLVDFLKQVTLFEDLSRWDLRRLARIVHERDYHDGEYIFQEGKPGAALFVLRTQASCSNSSGREQDHNLMQPTVRRARRTADTRGYAHRERAARWGRPRPEHPPGFVDCRMWLRGARPRSEPGGPSWAVAPEPSVDLGQALLRTGCAGSRSCNPGMSHTLRTPCRPRLAPPPAAARSATSRWRPSASSGWRASAPA